MTIPKVMSINAQCIGTSGKIFMVVAIAYDEKGNKVDDISLRLSDNIIKDEWTMQKVLPSIDAPITHAIEDRILSHIDAIDDVYTSLLHDFAKWYNEHGTGYKVICYDRHNIKSSLLYGPGRNSCERLFAEICERGFVEWVNAPIIVINIPLFLTCTSCGGDVVREYAMNNRLDMDDYGNGMNPLFDCEVAYRCYKNVIENNRLE